MENGLLHGVMEGLNDPYSVYYTADEYKELQISTTGTYYGIGAALKQDPNTKQVTVSKVYSGTPSEEAGLKKDDEIVSVMVSRQHPRISQSLLPKSEVRRVLRLRLKSDVRGD